MNDFLVIVGFIGASFGIGYDMSCYNIMRKVDGLYKKRNKWIFGYNTYMVWKTSRTVMKED